MSAADVRGAVIANAIHMSVEGLMRFLPGFDDSNRTTQAPHLPNHVAWHLGHCAMYMHVARRAMDLTPLPSHDFCDGEPRTPNQFDTETVCFGSVPVDDPERYPPLNRCVEVLRASGENLAGVFERAETDILSRTTSWGSVASLTFSDLGLRLAFHNSTHAGQIIDLRRALGFGSIIVPR